MSEVVMLSHFHGAERRTVGEGQTTTKALAAVRHDLGVSQYAHINTLGDERAVFLFQGGVYPPFLHSHFLCP